MVVQFSILVSNNDALLALGYTRLEIWQSLDSGNSYNELTASVPTAAIVDSFVAQTTYQMGGRLLKYKVNGGAEQSVAFSSVVDFWTPAQVVGRINEVTPSLASVVGNAVRLTSPTTGRASSVEITYNDAPDLGFVIGITYGKDARLPLLPNQLTYDYTDVSGTSGARYRWRYTNDGANPLSEFAPYILGTSLPSIGSNNLSICTAVFVGLDGQPFQATVVVAAEQNPASISGLVVANMNPLVFTAGPDGFLQFSLVRGVKVRVGIEGTSFVREIVVPDAPSFDLLALLTDAPDPFTVQTTPPFLIRRSI